MDADRAREGGRPSKLTPERAEKIIELIKVGNYIDVACAASGVNQHTFYRWLRIGRDLTDQWGEDPDEWPTEDWSEHEHRCVTFYLQIKQANAEAEAFAVASVRKQFGSQWAAAMTFLERRFPDRWKRREALETNNPFDPVANQRVAGPAVDEDALLRNGEASKLMHEALAAAAGEGAKGLPAAGGSVDGSATEITEP